MLFSILLVLAVAVIQSPGEWITGTWVKGYWDCCKPSCAWRGKGRVDHPVVACHKDTGLRLQRSDSNAQSICDGGVSATCIDNQPFLVNKNLSMGFAAAAVGGGFGLHGDVNCGQCYELQFATHQHDSGGLFWGGAHPDLVGKSHVVQVTNIVNNITSEHSFDLMIPGAGQGLYSSSCAVQFPGYRRDAFDCGNLYGCSDVNECASLPPKLRSGCVWRFDWFKWLVRNGTTNNPYVQFRRVKCPSELIAISGSTPTDDDAYPSNSFDRSEGIENALVRIEEAVRLPVLQIYVSFGCFACALFVALCFLGWLSLWQVPRRTMKKSASGRVVNTLLTESPNPFENPAPWNCMDVIKLVLLFLVMLFRIICILVTILLCWMLAWIATVRVRYVDVEGTIWYDTPLSGWRSVILRPFPYAKRLILLILGFCYIDVKTWSAPIYYSRNYMDEIRNALKRDAKDDDVIQVRATPKKVKDLFDLTGCDLRSLFPIVVKVQEGWSEPINYAKSTFWNSIRKVLKRDEKDDDLIKTQTNLQMTVDDFRRFTGEVTGEDLNSLFPIYVFHDWSAPIRYTEGINIQKRICTVVRRDAKHSDVIKTKTNEEMTVKDLLNYTAGEEKDLYPISVKISAWSEPIDYAGTFWESIRKALGRVENDDDVYSSFEEMNMKELLYKEENGDDIQNLFPLKVKVNFERDRRPSNSKIIVAAPHASELDNLVLSSVWGEALPAVGDKKIMRAPFIGRIGLATHAIFVNLATMEGKEKCKDAIKHRATTWTGQPLLVFPEGRTTNGKVLIQFKEGAFHPKAAVLPVTIRYPSWNFSPVGQSVTNDRILSWTFRLLTQVKNNCEVTVLDLYTPNFNESVDDFANNVRGLMAKTIRVKTTEHSYDDARFFIMTREHSVGTPEFAIRQIQERFGFELHELEKILKCFKFHTEGWGFDHNLLSFAGWKKSLKHSSIKDLLGASPKTAIGCFFRPALIRASSRVDRMNESMFKLFDRDGDGKLTFNEFVISIAVLGGRVETVADKAALVFSMLASEGNLNGSLHTNTLRFLLQQYQQQHKMSAMRLADYLPDVKEESLNFERFQQLADHIDGRYSNLTTFVKESVNTGLLTHAFVQRAEKKVRRSSDPTSEVEPSLRKRTASVLSSPH